MGVKYQKPFRLGIALIISGPSGAGKSTVCGELRRHHPELRFSVSCTTRGPRPGEVDGADYHFIGEADFRRRLAEGDFIEHAEVHGNLYGTLESELTARVGNGEDVLLDIDVQGALQIKASAAADPLLRKCVEMAFVGPPNFEELERRLRGRGTEDELVVRRRLANAKVEMAQWREYDYLVINKEVDKAVADMVALVDVLRKKTSRLADSGFIGVM